MDGLNMSRRIRRTPYTDRVEQVGVRGFSVVNHMLLPKAFQTSVEEDYWHLREHVQIWDVSCQRQVQIQGPDAAALVQWMTPRNIGKAKVGDCLYIPIIDAQAGLINDPVMLKLAEDRFWLSIADSDVLLYAMGIALGRGMDVQVSEPDVSPLAIQGPKAEDLLAGLFGDHIRDIGFFKYGWITFQGTRQLIARSGYSRQGGFEIYLEGGHLGSALWDAIWQAGQPLNITPGCPNLIERIEGGLLSYGNDMTDNNTPHECGLGKFCNTNTAIGCVGRDALLRVAKEGPVQQIRPIAIDGDALPGCDRAWPLYAGGKKVGQVTSAAWSPDFGTNVAIGMVRMTHWEPGTELEVETHHVGMRKATVQDTFWN